MSITTDNVMNAEEFVTDQREDNNSVEISINAKNKWSAKLKCYNKTSDGALQDALNKAEMLDEIIKRRNHEEPKERTP